MRGLLLLPLYVLFSIGTAVKESLVGWLVFLVPVGIGSLTVPIAGVVLRFRGWFEGLPDVAKRLIAASIAYWGTQLATLGITFTGKLDEDLATVLAAVLAFVFYGHKKPAKAPTP